MKLFSSALLLVVVIILKRSTEWVSCVKKEDSSSQHLTTRPIVGVLSQKASHTTQYLTIVNVKWLEAAGARVVPILIDQPNRYYRYIMDRINGVMFPGGMASHLTSGFALAADKILDIAVAKNERGIHFPVWGSCQGFQKLVTYFAGNKNTNWITMCRTMGISLNLDFTPGLDLYKQTRMFEYGQQIVPILAKYPVTPNSHWYCLTTEDFYRMPNLSSSLTLISSNSFNGTQFVSTIEHRKYPFFGTQWHPELPQFKNYNGNNSANTYRSIVVAQYLANFFVNQTRKNNQHYRWDSAEESEMLIDSFRDYLKTVTYVLPL